MEVILDSISKSYQQEQMALDRVSFEVGPGELFGLIGPDGGGKTTLFRILTTLLLADNGTASISGYDVVKHYRKIRRSVGYMPGKFSLYQDLTVLENLHFFATIFNTTIEENYELVKEIYVQIEPFNQRRAANLSGGMKQKLALCCALIHHPKVLFLDEPTTGVDAVSRKEFWEMLKRLKDRGITILVSTPYMDEASLCEKIALLQEGRILSVDTPDSIIARYPKQLYAVKSPQMGKLLARLRNAKEVDSANAFGEYHHITFVDDEPIKREQLVQMLQLEEELTMIRAKPSIEDCFIDLMKAS